MFELDKGNPDNTSNWYNIELIADDSNTVDEDLSDDVRKNRAYQIIFNRKFEQELQRTLMELRSEAYVDIKLAS